MSLRRVVVCVAAVVTLGLAGCSGTDEGTDAGTAAAGPTAGADEAAGADDSAAAKDVCEHLTKELPRIKAVGSEVGAMAQLTMSLASFYEDHEKVADGTVLDEQTEKACPEVRAEMLKAAGMKSFADF